MAILFKKRNSEKTTIKSENSPCRITPSEYGRLSDAERAQWVPVKTKYEKIPIFCIVSLILAAICIIIYVISCLSEKFADFFNLYAGSAFRFIFAKATNILPFSFAELLILLIPIILFLSIWYLLKYRCNSLKSSLVSIVCVLSIASLFLSSFILCFGVGYRGSSLDKKIDITPEPIGAEELYGSAIYLIEKINQLSEDINYREDDFSKMPYSFNEMNRKLLEAYEKYCENNHYVYNYNTRLKPVMLSEAMSYTHITGVYTFFTGEANINVDFPDYTIPYTAAHELAHQRGICPEDEANMVAFLVCIESDDPYIQYSAYLNVYEYVASALYKADKDLYREARAKLLNEVREEQVAYSNFFDKYEKSVASQVSGVVNDVYLKAQGTPGKKSYGMVVDLTVAYLKKHNLIEN